MSSSARPLSLKSLSFVPMLRVSVVRVFSLLAPAVWTPVHQVAGMWLSQCRPVLSGALWALVCRSICLPLSARDDSTLGAGITCVYTVCTWQSPCYGDCPGRTLNSVRVKEPLRFFLGLSGKEIIAVPFLVIWQTRLFGPTLLLKNKCWINIKNMFLKTLKN